MGKNAKFRLPEPPTEPIVVLDRYDTFFREKLLRAIRDDFQRFPEGLPTYHKYVTRIVGDYAGDLVNPDALSLKDLANFLAGMRSHTPRIAVLDAFVQIARPGLRTSFTISKYAEHVGYAFAEFAEVPWTDAERRDRYIAALTGVHEILPSEDDADVQPRYLVLRPNASRAFLLIYEFSMAAGAIVLENTGHDLVSGILVVNPTAGLFMMRNFRFTERRLGELIYGWNIEFNQDNERIHHSPSLQYTYSAAFSGKQEIKQLFTPPVLQARYHIRKVDRPDLERHLLKISKNLVII